jgi:hypothetical protein
VLVWAPHLYLSGFKQHHVDGDALAVHASLCAAGYDSTLLDAYYRGRPAASLSDTLAAEAGPFTAVIAHLFTSDAYGPRLQQIADELATVRQQHGVAVIGFGPLAVSAAAELAAHGAVDYVVNGSTAPAPTATLAALIDQLRQHLQTPTPMTLLTAADLPYASDAVISVTASRGCRSRCTFCAYNAEMPGGGWVDLSMDQALADVVHLHQSIGATQFAFTDSDFGGNRADCHNRAVALRNGIRSAGLAETLTFAISVRSETLTEDTVAILADAGVRTMLIGVESLNPDTLHRVYGKRQDLAHLRHIIDAADAAGVTVLASYILWHPWQSRPALRAELDALDMFGRHRVPQFMARSRVLVIPGTIIERRIRDAGLLNAGPFRRDFRIADPEAAALYDDLRAWFATHAAPVIGGLHEQQDGAFDRLAELKVAEWAWLRQTVSHATEAPAHV